MHRTWQIVSVLALTLGLMACGKIRYVPEAKPAISADTKGINGGNNGSGSADAGGVDAGDGSADAGGDGTADAGDATAGGDGSAGTADADGGGDADAGAGDAGNEPTVTGLTITPATVSIPLGTTQSLLVMANFSDGSEKDVSTEADFDIADTEVIQTTEAGPNVFLAAKIGTTTINVSFDGATGSVQITVTDAVIQSLAIEPADATLVLGFDHFIKAIGTYSDGSQQTVTTQTSFDFGQDGIVTADKLEGDLLRLKTLKAGSLTFTGTYEGQTAEAKLTVVAANLVSLAVKPASATIKMGESIDLMAEATSDTGDTYNVTANVTWASDDEAIAKVSNTPGQWGQVRGVEKGTAIVTATLGDTGLSATSTITVNVSDDIMLTGVKIVDMAGTQVETATIYIGKTYQYQAMGTYSDNKDRLMFPSEVTWSSGDAAILTVDASGLVTPVAEGEAALRVVSGEFLASATMTVVLAKVQDSFDVEATPAVLDMIMLVDNSVSMDAEIKTVQNNINAFTNYMREKTDINVHIISAAPDSRTAKDPIFHLPITVPFNGHIYHYDFEVGSMQALIMAAIVSCPAESNVFTTTEEPVKVCGEDFIGMYGVGRLMQPFAGLDYEFNGLLHSRLRENSKRIYVLVTDDDIVDSSELGPVVDQGNFAEVVGKYSYDYPTVFAFAPEEFTKTNGDGSETDVLCTDSDIEGTATRIQQLAANTGGELFSICDPLWEIQDETSSEPDFSQLAEAVLALKNNKFTLSNANIKDIISVKQGDRVIPADKYMINGNILTVHPSVVELGSGDPLTVEYSYIPE